MLILKCLGSDVKAFLRQVGADIDLDSIPTCPASPIEVEEVSDLGGKGRTKGKRKPSAYNLFMSKCIREIETEGSIQERFKRCAARYKEMKKEGS